MVSFRLRFLERGLAHHFFWKKWPAHCPGARTGRILYPPSPSCWPIPGSASVSPVDCASPSPRLLPEASQSPPPFPEPPPLTRMCRGRSSAVGREGVGPHGVGAEPSTVCSCISNIRGRLPLLPPRIIAHLRVVTIVVLVLVGLRDFFGSYQSTWSPVHGKVPCVQALVRVVVKDTFGCGAYLDLRVVWTPRGYKGVRGICFP